MIVRQMWDSSRELVVLNDTNWGLATREFPEVEILRERKSH